ncbi:unnamed protein product [Ambrosiozyma monospora]|uniref:Unnamed protein product n=1 Tax=Ambrosiozyma monospora TaxID=43982 RepID=A0ACB5T2I0_AMBMO|nr:unnamed protein product [Ambrosiozyma monospora]
MSQKHTVIVIGAGISGIKSAIDLTANGVENIILESRDRVGGRLHTHITENGLKFDMGASWFHDCLVNPLLKKSLDKDNVEFFFDNGKSGYYNKEVGLIPANYKIQPVVDEIVAFLKLNYEELEPKDDRSFREAIFEYLKFQKDILTEDQIKFAPQVMRRLELWMGTSWKCLSARIMSSMDGHLGRDAFLLSGYGASVYQNELLELAQLNGFKTTEEFVSKKEKLLLNKQVFKVAFDDSTKEICVSVVNENGKVEQYYSDYLISSVPLSVLQLKDPKEKGAIQWDPPLPSSLVSALDNITYSALGKVFFEFDEVFWPADTERFICIPSEDKELTNGVLNNQPVWFGPKEKNDKPLDSSVTPDGFDYNVLLLNLYRSTGKPLIGALIATPLTNYVESNPVEKVWPIFKPLLANVSGLKPEQVKEPKQIIKTNWTNDPYARGSYLGGSVGDNPELCLKVMTEAKNIFDGKGRVRFVGEALIDVGDGCAHGAWWSAEREVKQLLKLINKSKL